MYELFILKRIVLDDPRWCNRHISREDLTKGTVKDQRHLYRDAVDSLVRKGYQKQYKSQGRVDLCVIKEYKYQIIGFFRMHENEYQCLKGLDYSRIR
jgi:hypothetical protein